MEELLIRKYKVLDKPLKSSVHYKVSLSSLVGKFLEYKDEEFLQRYRSRFITGGGVKNLGQSLAKLPKLQEICLDFHWYGDLRETFFKNK